MSDDDDHQDNHQDDDDHQDDHQDDDSRHHSIDQFPPAAQQMIREARREAAGYRRRLRDTEAGRDEEIERAVEQAVTRTRTEVGENLSKSVLDAHLKLAATRVGARNPDILARLARDELPPSVDIADGDALTVAIDAAVAAVAATAPELIGGSNDGRNGLRIAGAGARSGGALIENKDPDAWIREASDR